MQIEIQEKEYCKLNVSYTESLETILDKTNEVALKFKGLNVPGFRNGKAPLDAVQMHYRKQINEELKRTLAENAYFNTITEKNIKPFGKPIFNSLDLDKLSFKCDFDILKKPDFELSKYKEFDIPKPSVDITVEEFAQKTLEELRVKFGEITPFTANDFVQDKDNLIINYTGTIDGNKIDSLCADGELLTIGSTPIPGFDENLLGMKIDETRIFSIPAPQNSLEEFKNKVVEFTVTLQAATKIVPAPLDDSFAIKTGFKDFNDLMTNINTAASHRISVMEKNKITDQVIKQLVSNHQFEVPYWLSLAEAKVIAQNFKADWEKMGNEERETIIGRAQNNVRLSLILEKIRENEPDAQLTDEEALGIIKNQLQQTQGENFKKTYEDFLRNGYLPIIMSRIIDEHTIDFIAKSSKIID